MKLTRKKYYIIEIGVLIGIATALLTFCTTFYWQQQGFNDATIILLSIIGGVYLFISTLLIHYFYTNYILKKENFKNFKRRYSIPLILIISMLTYLLVDSLIFLFDNSLSQEFQELLNAMTRDENSMLNELYPFGILNSVVTLLFGLFSSFLSLFIIKKNFNKNEMVIQST